MGILQRLKNQEGAVAVMAAAAMVGLLGLAAVVVDAGLLYVAKARLANIADAAALAGAQELLPGRGGDPYGVARDYAAQNGLGAYPSDTIDVTCDASSVTVTVSRTLPLFFAPVYGYRSATVSATATAAAGAVAEVTGAVPLAVEKQQFIYGASYTLKEGGGGGTTGNFDALALGGKGADVYEINLAYGYSDVLHVGDWVYTKTGDMSGPTTSGITTRLNADPTATFPPDNLNSPRVVIVPVVDSLDVNGSKPVQIVGFAAFFLEGVGGSGSSNYVTGRFIQIPAAASITTDPNAYYGVFNIRLVN